MGYAQIVSGGPDGRYVISLDFGDSLRAALAEAANSALIDLTAKVDEQQVVVAEADDAESATAANLTVLFEQIAADIAESPGVVSPAQRVFDDLMEIRRRQQIQHEPSRMALRALKAAKAEALKQVAKWQNLTVTGTRNAWCADYTENASGFVATLEIPGESDLILIEPGAPEPSTNVHGAMFDRALLSPATAFYNAALLPGWQKYKPTFRWGTITALDYEAHTADVDLAAATSSAQGLGVNQASTLTAVPVEYMGCDSAVFNVGSRVVVKFTGQDWTQPKVIGFLDNPVACGFACIGERSPGTGGGGEFSFRMPSEVTPFILQGWSWQYRLNGGPWEDMTTNDIYAGPTLLAYRKVGPVIDLGRIPNNANFDDDHEYGAAEVVVGTAASFVVMYGPAPMPPGNFPNWPIVDPVKPRDRWVYEFRARSGGETVFNAAMTDNLNAAEDAVDAYLSFVKARGGIDFNDERFPGSLYSLVNGTPTGVLDYALTGSTP